MLIDRPGCSQPAKRHCADRGTRFGGSVFSAALGVTIVSVLTLSVGLAPGAQADDLQDRQDALELKITEVEQSLEFLDMDIAKALAQLETYQSQLPAAQEELAVAQGRVAKATDEVTALSERVDRAQETKDKISQQLNADTQKMADTKDVIGQIATHAYKNGGVPSSLSLILGADGAENLTRSINMADQVMRSQGAAVDRLAQQNATNVNSVARLGAVEAEVKDLKTQADTALADEKEARDDAASKKAHVDKLVSDTSALSDKLEAKKPQIKAKLAKTEAAQKHVQEQVADRQRKLLEEAKRREEQRQREAAAVAKAAAKQQALLEADRLVQIERERAAAAAANQPMPALPPPIPAALPAESSPATQGAASAFGLRYPVKASITSDFGYRATPEGTIDFGGTGGYLHSGIDFAPPCGTAVYAPASGEVWYADQGGEQMIGTGNRLVINHGVTQGNVLATNFYHLESMAVHPGQRVSAGQLIGRVGSTGNSTGCHLHFETMLNGDLVNPMGLL